MRQTYTSLMYSVSTGLLGSLLGASLANWMAGRMRPKRNREIHRDARVGFYSGVGFVLFALRNPLLRQQNAAVPESADSTDYHPALAPYDELALAGNRGLRNARRLTPDLRQKLGDMLAGVPRSPESDRTVHHLIRILHDEDEAPETRQLIEKLAVLLEECESPGGLHGLRFLARVEAPISSWQFLKQGASTATVLGAGIRAACTEKANKDKARDGPHADAESMSPPPRPCDDQDRDEILQFLGAYEPWKDHLKRHFLHYESCQSLIQDIVDKAMDALSDCADTLADRVYLDGCYYLARANRGELLAQWVAEACLKDARFIENGSAVEGWLRERLAMDFRCPGLDGSRVTEVNIARTMGKDGTTPLGAGRESLSEGSIPAG